MKAGRVHAGLERGSVFAFSLARKNTVVLFTGQAKQFKSTRFRCEQVNLVGATPGTGIYTEEFQGSSLFRS